MVPHASIISESEVSITVFCLLCLPRYTAGKNVCSHICNQSSHYEKHDGAACHSYYLKLKYPLPFLSAMFDLLHSSTNQELFEKHLCKNEWNTKEDTVKSLKNALHVLRYAKRHLSG